MAHARVADGLCASLDWNAIDELRHGRGRFVKVSQGQKEQSIRRSFAVGLIVSRGIYLSLWLLCGVYWLVMSTNVSYHFNACYAAACGLLGRSIDYWFRPALVLFPLLIMIFVVQSIVRLARHRPASRYEIAMVLCVTGLFLYSASHFSAY